MKYLYNHKQLDPIQIRIKESGKQEYNADNEYTIQELFNMKKTNKYEKIEIRKVGLYYKEKKNSKIKNDITGWINLMEYENGGEY